MLKTRLIPVLLLQNGSLVRSETFSTHQIIGNPVNEVKRYNEWNVDELVYLDITRNGGYEGRRTDHRIQSPVNPLEILKIVCANCFMPLTWGGRIRDLDRMRECFRLGADKILINTAAVDSPRLIADAAGAFGSQAVVVGIDARRGSNGQTEVFIDAGRTPTGMRPERWAKEAQNLGAGEIFLQSIDRDGTGAGYDLALIRSVADAVDIPLIACGGVGTFEHYPAGIAAGASAVAAANIWHFKELSDRHGKRAMARAGIHVRL